MSEPPPKNDPSTPGHVPQREAAGEDKPHRRELTEYEPAPPATPDPKPD